MNIKKLKDSVNSRLQDEYEELLNEYDFTPEEEQKKVIEERVKEIRQELSQNGFPLSELSKPSFL